MHTQDTMNARPMTRKLLNQTRVFELENALKNAPPPPKKLTQNETLVELAPSMREALSRGHTIESLVAVLAVEGLLISARGLAKLLRQQIQKTGTVGSRKKTHTAASAAV